MTTETPVTMDTVVVIRPAVEDDFPVIAAITNHYIQNTAIHFGTDLLTAEDHAAPWRQSRDHYPYLVATRAGAVVAYAKASVWRERAAYRHTTETGIYVAPDAHGAGIGKQLYTTLIAAIDAAGFHTIVAGIALPNDRSFALHRALGFTEVGTFREVGFKFDRWHDVSWWQRVVPARS
jgi:L-amino acid N-acyltransferase YncA